MSSIWFELWIWSFPIIQIYWFPKCPIRQTEFLFLSVLAAWRLKTICLVLQRGKQFWSEGGMGFEQYSRSRLRQTSRHGGLSATYDTHGWYVLPQLFWQIVAAVISRCCRRRRSVRIMRISLFARQKAAAQQPHRLCTALCCCCFVARCWRIEHASFLSGAAPLLFAIYNLRPVCPPALPRAYTLFSFFIFFSSSLSLLQPFPFVLSLLFVHIVCTTADAYYRITTNLLNSWKSLRGL